MDADSMQEHSLPYDKWIEQALRGVIGKALAHAVEHGLPGDHHFYITFRTDAEGVGLAPRLRAQYPEAMTIVLQHQFWDLEVDDAGFGVTLKFRGKAERLRVPFAAVTGFADPVVNFGLQLKVAPFGGGEDGDIGEQGASEPATDLSGAGTGAAADDAAERGEVIALDKFRKK